MQVWIVHHEDPARGDEYDRAFDSDVKAAEHLRDVMETDMELHYELDWKKPHPALLEEWREGQDWVEAMKSGDMNAPLAVYKDIVEGSPVATQLSLDLTELS